MRTYYASALITNISSWEADFFSMRQRDLLNIIIIMAASSLEVNSLMDVACKIFAEREK